MAATRLHVVGEFWQIRSEKHNNASNLFLYVKKFIKASSRNSFFPALTTEKVKDELLSLWSG